MALSREKKSIKHQERRGNAILQKGREKRGYGQDGTREKSSPTTRLGENRMQTRSPIARGKRREGTT